MKIDIIFYMNFLAFHFKALNCIWLFYLIILHLIK